MPGIIWWEASGPGTGSPRSRSQRSISAISSRCPTTIRSQSTRRAWPASCDGAQPAISTACA